ncbi:MAG: hypothetical protein ACYTEQ_21610 [Planctomycetota bacterium]
MDYRPRKNEWFKAFHKRLKFMAHGNPCRATKVTAAVVEAVDSDECERLFYRHAWRFEKAEAPKRRKAS